jgi:hypothetical protein
MRRWKREVTVGLAFWAALLRAVFLQEASMLGPKNILNFNRFNEHSQLRDMYNAVEYRHLN